MLTHGQFHGGLGKVFMVDTEKKDLGFLVFFFTPSQHIWQGLRRLSTSVQAKKGVAKHYNDS